MTSRTIHSARRLAAVALLAVTSCLVLNTAPSVAALRRPGTTAPDCGPRIKKNALTAWKCTFADDFSGTSLDAAKWQAITTAANGQTAGAACFLRSAHNISVHDGALHLTARQEAGRFTCASPKGNFATRYSSGQVASYGRFAQTYGRFAVRAKFPATTVAGLQSSLWMWPENPVLHRAVGEIDIAEWFSDYSDRAIPYIHYLFKRSTTNPVKHVNIPTRVTCLIARTAAFHEYVAEWTRTAITIKYDRRTCLTDYYRPSGTNPFAQPYFVALSQALGLAPNTFRPGVTRLPATTVIDWVRVWK